MPGVRGRHRCSECSSTGGGGGGGGMGQIHKAREEQKRVLFFFGAALTAGKPIPKPAQTGMASAE